ncbi:MAG: VanW family protein [Parcubacteria group bacterium]|nr:VanW family protein [Parcubacteria group bacterium]
MKLPLFLPLYIVIFLIIAAEIEVVSVQLLAQRRIMPRIVLGEAALGGLDFASAEARTRSEIARFQGTPIEFVFPDSLPVRKALPHELGIILDEAATIERLKRYGRTGNFGSDLLTYLRAPFGEHRIPSAYQFESTKNFPNLYVGVETPAKNFSYELRQRREGGYDFFPDPASSGRVVDDAHADAEVRNIVAALAARPRILVRMKRDDPRVSRDPGEAGRKKTEVMLAGAPYHLTFEGEQWEIAEHLLAEWIEFRPEKVGAAFEIRPGIKSEEAEQFFSNLAVTLNREAVNAQFELRDGRVGAFALAQDGVLVDVPASIHSFDERIRNGQKETPLIVKRVHPEITAEKINSLGITALLGRGISDFAGSPRNRIHNITVGAAKFNGVLIPPGEEFSFNAYIGEVSARGGYLPALVIKKNNTIFEYGGGLCQVSTTAFRAAIYSGLEITARAPHAFPVKYYNPQGFDASIYAPYLDLKFRNNTPGYILIQTRVEGTQLIFEFFGTDDGREVTLLGPYEYEKKSNGSLKAYFIRTIVRNGTTIEERRFDSRYKSPVLYPVERNPLE